MPLSLIVPPQPANPAHLFSFTLVESGTTRQYTLNKSLTENTVSDLRFLAKKIGLSGTGRLKKKALADALEPYVFFTTRAEAEAQFPILAEPLAPTAAALAAQRQALDAAFSGFTDPNFVAHVHTRYAEIDAAHLTLAMDERDRAMRASGKEPPLWWELGHWDKEEDWEDYERPEGSYLKVVVEVTERSHDGYCSGVEEDEDGHYIHFGGGEVEIEETKYKMIASLPLRDPGGAAWNYQGPAFDPGWRCATGGSGVCDVRPSVSFVSMERIE